MDKIGSLTSAYGEAVEGLQTSVSEGLEGLGYGGDVAVGFDLAEVVAKRNRTFVAQFGRVAEKAEEHVRASSDMLRGDVLNSVIMADANATSDIPAMSRTAAAACEASRIKLAEYDARAAVAPRLREEMLEAVAEKKLRMERKYLASGVPMDDKHARQMKRAMDGKGDKMKRTTQPPAPSLLGYD